MMYNPGQLFNERAKEHPHKVAVIAKDERVDYVTLNRRANRLAHALLKQGIRGHDRVGILLPNSSAFVVAYLAVQKVGGVAVPLDMKLPPQDVDELLKFDEAQLLITVPRMEGAVPTGRLVIAVEKDQVWCRGELLHASEDDVGVDRPADDEATYLYTSGSTGRPKVAVLTLGNLDCFPHVMYEIYGLTSHDVFGMVLPMSHVSGPIVVQELAARGSTLAILDLMTGGRAVLQSIAENRVSIIWGVMPIFQLLIREAKMRPYDMSSLHIIAVMGMETPVEFMNELSRTFPTALVLQGYGLTETAGVQVGTPPQEAIRKMKSIGRPASFMEVCIVDAEGRPLSAFESGEIIMRGPAIMKGYYRDEAATEERIRDGWLYTGAVGYFDEDGYLYLLGRTDDMIITGGLNVFPAEVEDVIRQHPQIKEVAVIGAPDPKRGAVVKAVIVPGGEVTKEEVLEFCRDHLAPFKCPRLVEFREELPKTSTGKIARGALRGTEASQTTAHRQRDCQELPND
jgi:acyl-CoA synthetase (AMP-forming)/AMP-acid ligase II